MNVSAALRSMYIYYILVALQASYSHSGRAPRINKEYNPFAEIFGFWKEFFDAICLDADYDKVN